MSVGTPDARRRRAGAAGSPEQEAFLSVVRAAEHLMGELAQLLKSEELSPSLYNILRILRGAGAEGLPCKEIGERMLTRDPDVTRLVDRLEARKLAARITGTEDRRVVKVRITGEGLTLLKRLDDPVRELHRAQFAPLGHEQLLTLNKLLAVARGGK